MTISPIEENVPLDREKIRALRLEKGWSHADAAKAAGMGSRQQWHGIESGERADPAISTVEKIARALGVPVDELLVKRR